MDAFSSSPLMESFPSSRFPSPDPSPTRTEVDLPTDVDASFNSSMSFGDSGASPMALSPTPLCNLYSKQPRPTSPLPLKAGSSGDAFLSPIPAFSLKPRRPDPVPIQMGAAGSSRAFGRELSPNVHVGMSRSSAGPATTKAKGMMLPPAVPDHRALARHRGGIPMQWTSSNEETGQKLFHPSLLRHETEPFGTSPRAVPSRNGSLELTMAMDIDSPAHSATTAANRLSAQASPAFSGSASFSGSPGLGSFFCDSPAAPSAVPPSKRRSLITGSPASPSSSPSAKRTSFGLASRNMEKTVSSSAMLFGPGRASTLAGRTKPYKRPPLMAMPPSEASASSSTRAVSASSAYPILCGTSKPTLGSSHGTFPRAAVAPMRRAFSVCDQPGGTIEQDDEESEFEASPSTMAMGAHAEYARRHGTKYVPRIDGSPGFKPARSSIAVSGEGMAVSPVGKGKKTACSPFGAGGLPGFGDNEMDGKILPCHKVKEDGLVRITSQTLDDLLAGLYDGKVKRYHVLDCRFDYEFEGGHIKGAVNVKSMDGLDEMLLKDGKGLYDADEKLPRPSRSGELAEGQPVVLVFHCEFSAKRAPTFAKHLRSRDRALNSAHYPKIIYPEVYILEGGYSGFYASRPASCEPQGYVPMDDPRHLLRRNSDLHDFRKFSRTRSFTYGETQPPPPLASSRQTAAPPLPCPPLAFAAASAAVGRRSNVPMTIDEHGNGAESSPDVSSTPSGGGSASRNNNDDSPCPRVVSLGGGGGLAGLRPPIFGSAKTRQFTRGGFVRVQSYAGTGTAAR